MASQVIITARIPDELKHRLDELGVNVSSLVRDSLEKEVKRLEMESLQKRAEESARILEKIPADDIVRNIRSGRDEH